MSPRWATATRAEAITTEPELPEWQQVTHKAAAADTRRKRRLIMPNMLLIRCARKASRSVKSTREEAMQRGEPGSL
jgi:hypothetical protein